MNVELRVLYIQKGEDKMGTYWSWELKCDNKHECDSKTINEIIDDILVDYYPLIPKEKRLSMLHEKADLSLRRGDWTGLERLIREIHRVERGSDYVENIPFEQLFNYEV